MAALRLVYGAPATMPITEVGQKEKVYLPPKSILLAKYCFFIPLITKKPRSFDRGPPFRGPADGKGPPLPSLAQKVAPFFDNLSHRPVERVSHLPARVVAYHSA